MDTSPESIPLQPIEEKKLHSYDEALQEAGFGRAQIILMLLAGLSVMASANESMGMGIILPASQCDLDLDLTRKGIVGGAVLTGVTISTYYWGYQTDIRGRQSVLKVTLLATAGFSFAASFANHFYLLVVLRFMVGLFVSAPSSAAIVYLGEFCPRNRRGQMVTYACTIGAAGFAYVALIAWWILSFEWSISITESFTIRPWRLLFLANALPGLITGLVYGFFPETPKFLLAQGRNHDALEVFRWLHRLNKGENKFYEVQALQSEAPQEKPTDPQQSESTLRKMRNQLAPLFKVPYVLYLVACSVQSLAGYVTYGGFGMWFPQIMNMVYSADSSTGSRRICDILQTFSATNQSVNATEPSAVCVDTLQQETFIYTLIIGGLSSGYLLLNSILLSKFTEKALIYANLITAGLAGIALQYVTHTYVVAILFSSQIVIGSVCVILIRTIQVSIFPTQVRATAVSLTNLTGRIGQVVANVFTGVLIVQHCTVTLYFVAALLLVSAGLNVMLP